MKWWLPVVVIVSAGLVLSGTGGDPVGLSLLIKGCTLLLVIVGIFFSFQNEKRFLKYTAAHLGGLGILIGCATTQFPFRTTFRFSEPALRQLALRVEQGQSPALPARAGLFQIRDAGLRSDGSIYLWTVPDPSGSQGFVFRYRGEGYNLWSEFRFNDDWYYICED